jgi:hypothetical protein
LTAEIPRRGGIAERHVGYSSIEIEIEIGIEIAAYPYR